MTTGFWELLMIAGLTLMAYGLCGLVMTVVLPRIVGPSETLKELDQAARELDEKGDHEAAQAIRELKLHLML